jgi:predicted secreted protein
MANGFNGGLCMIYKGLYASKTDIVGQGDASLTHNGAPIEISNKSTAGWRENLDGSTSTRSLDIDIEFTTSDDTSFETLVTDAFAGTVGEYTMLFTDVLGTSGYYYEGNFTPVISSETASKDTAATVSVQFMSSLEITRTTLVP